MKRKDYCFKFAQMLNKLIFEKIVKHMQGNFCAKKEIDIILKNKRINIYKLINNTLLFIQLNIFYYCLTNYLIYIYILLFNLLYFNSSIKYYKK